MLSLRDFLPSWCRPEACDKPLTTVDLHSQLRQAALSGIEEAQERQARQEKEDELQKVRAAQVKRNQDQAHQAEALESFGKIPQLVRRDFAENPDTKLSVIFILCQSEAVMFRKVGGNADQFIPIDSTDFELVRDGHLKLTGTAKYFFELCCKAALAPCVVRSRKIYPQSERDGVRDSCNENMIHIAIPVANWKE